LLDRACLLFHQSAQHDRKVDFGRILLDRDSLEQGNSKNSHVMGLALLTRRQVMAPDESFNFQSNPLFRSTSASGFGRLADLIHY
jgi:hypothetical protein